MSRQDGKPEAKPESESSMHGPDGNSLAVDDEQDLAADGKRHETSIINESSFSETINDETGLGLHVATGGSIFQPGASLPPKTPEPVADMAEKNCCLIL